MTDIVDRIPLEEIDETSLIRDRTVLDAEAQAELRHSVMTNGLRLPIEVYALGSPKPTHRYGLISGGFDPAHKVFGYGLGRNIDARLTRASLSAANEVRRPLPSCVFHAVAAPSVLHPGTDASRRQTASLGR